MAGIAVLGITGRMGQSLVRALRGPDSPTSGLQLSGALASPQSSRLGEDAAVDGPPIRIVVTANEGEALVGADVALDFSSPTSAASHVRACAAAGVPLLLGTTGLAADVHAALESAARNIALLVAPNTSVGVALMTRLVKHAASALGDEFDIEISEAHHRMKRDAPSGTALALGRTVAASRGRELRDAAVFDRSAVRRAGDIGFAVSRGGDIVGEHTVCFAGAGERLEITHRATDRMIFAHGALAAARWLIGRRPGLYAMDDVLGP